MTGRYVHLLRHGPPLRPGLMHGHNDEPPADPSGGLSGIVPSGLTVRHVVSSDLRRALAGAEVLSRELDAALTVDSRWRELDFGDWNGACPASLDCLALARFWEDPESNAPPGGERWSEIIMRVRAALAHLPADVLVVTHGGAMRAAIAALTGLGSRQVWAVDLPYRALLSVRIWPGEELSGQIVGLHSGKAT